MSFSEERRFKLDMARQILRRYGPPSTSDLPLDWIDTGTRAGFRVRGRFRVEVEGGRVALGFRSTALDGRLTDVRDCPAHHPMFLELVNRFGQVMDLHPEAALAVASLEIWTWPRSALSPQTRPSPAALVVLHLTSGGSDLLHSLLCECFRPAEVAVGFLDTNRRIEMAWGHPSVLIEHRIAPEKPTPRPPIASRPGPLAPIGARPTFEKVPIEVPWGCWYHPHPEAAQRLGDWVLARLEPFEHRCVLDLCCGVGTLTLLMARRFRRLVAVDEDYRALQAIQRAAAIQGLDRIELRVGRLGTILRKLRREGDSSTRPTAAVINPMRKPLGIRHLADLAPLGVRQVLYLGPSAVSAARDALELTRTGFRLERMAAVNLHPGTSQLMLAIELSR